MDLNSLVPLEPSSLAEARDLARDIVESGLFPKIRTPGGALVFILTARDLRLPLSQALRMVDVIEGRQKCPDTGQMLRVPTISLRAELQIALVRRDPRCALLELAHDPTAPGADPTWASWRTAFKSRPHEIVDATFTLAEAQRLGLTERKQWAAQAGTMLIWRAATRLIRRYWADVTLGLSDPDEVRESAPIVEATLVSSTTNSARLAAAIGGHASRVPSEDHVARLRGLYAELARHIGPDDARRRWTEVVGDTATTGEWSPEELISAIERAQSLVHALEDAHGDD
jgi:hypothetical protein